MHCMSWYTTYSYKVYGIDLHLALTTIQIYSLLSGEGHKWIGTKKKCIQIVSRGIFFSLYYLSKLQCKYHKTTQCNQKYTALKWFFFFFSLTYSIATFFTEVSQSVWNQSKLRLWTATDSVYSFFIIIIIIVSCFMWIARIKWARKRFTDWPLWPIVTGWIHFFYFANNNYAVTSLQVCMTDIELSHHQCLAATSEYTLEWGCQQLEIHWPHWSPTAIFKTNLEWVSYLNHIMIEFQCKHRPPSSDTIWI